MIGIIISGRNRRDGLEVSPDLLAQVCLNLHSV